MPPERLEAGYRRIVGGLGDPWHQPSRWHALNDPLEDEYTRRIVAVAQKHSVETIFVRLLLSTTVTMRAMTPMAVA